MLKLKKLKNRYTSQINPAFSMAVAVTGIIGCAAVSVVYIIFNSNKDRKK